MSTLYRANGDLLVLARKGQFDIIVHGANCFNKMASGIAGQISREHPEAASVDLSTRAGDRSKLGRWSMVKVHGEGSHTFYIVNAYTQYSYGRGKDIFEYDFFRDFLKSFQTFLRSGSMAAPLDGKFAVGFPYIGCGLAGGDEEKIVNMLESFSESCRDIADVTLVRYVR
jgi:O-acetyl-ADP-ribose deacetylase (regulator of RNase III)